MRIKEDDSLVMFGNIDSGDVFFAEGHYYLKMYAIGDIKFNVVDLESGKADYFEYSDRVIIKNDAELVVN